MKKQFHALSLCLTLALCVFGSTAALAEAPAATPAPQDQRVITDVSPLEDQIRNIVGFTTSTGGPYDFEQADHRSAVQAYGAEPAEGAVALLRIYARAEDRGDASINSSGHSFLSVRNVSDHDIEVGGLRIAPNTEMTFSPPRQPLGAHRHLVQSGGLLQALSGRFLLPEHLCCPDFAGSGPAGRGQPQPCQI